MSKPIRYLLLICITAIMAYYGCIFSSAGFPYTSCFFSGLIISIAVYTLVIPKEKRADGKIIFSTIIAGVIMSAVFSIVGIFI